MDERRAAVRTLVLLDFAERFERLAKKASAPDVRDRFLKVANDYRQRAEKEQRDRQQKDGS